MRAYLKGIIKFCLFVIGLCIALTGLLFLIVCIRDMGDPSASSFGPVGDIIFLCIIGLAPLIGGVIMCRWALRIGRNRITPDPLENNILKLAEQRNGSLTAVELAMDTELSLGEAKAKLDKWANEGYVTIKISDSGALIYQFNGIISNEERKMAKGVSEFE
ncbi:hypothetical protein SAMN04487944_10352 [Gracilibacillus ureilyticus]|uniref:Uncharacterized protein n=1 Tax=Gracilibacillus ureilyticus TaxID=531814 RepID=A0A1H9NB38_9BACI|nr:hypothetical protein [Gracilibacillus ureilyticus]SER33142.1 hypothetical protein SAMN04487944_10352 [Gracilibacillus ureilyticus]